jgi:hypothetical protein
MFIKEFEKIEIAITKKLATILSKKSNKVFVASDKSLVHWSLLRTTTFRTSFIKVKCDDCNIIFERRIRDLNVDKKIHYCASCVCSGDRNGGYGKPMSESFKLASKNFMLKYGNPFTWDSTKEKIKEKKPWLKAHEKNKGSKRTTEQKERMSEAAKQAFKKGTRIPNKRWGITKIETYKGIDYQSSYELKFIKLVEGVGLLKYLDRGPIIEYFDLENKFHNYFSDFKLKNSDIVFEIKSTYTWEKNLEINLIKKVEAEKRYDYHLILDNKFKKVKKILLEYAKKIQ